MTVGFISSFIYFMKILLWKRSILFPFTYNMKYCGSISYHVIINIITHHMMLMISKSQSAYSSNGQTYDRQIDNNNFIYSLDMYIH